MRSFDAMLVFGYALDQYLAKETTLSPTAVGKDVCLENRSGPWKDGPRLLQYLTNVCI